MSSDETIYTCTPPFIPNIQISGDGGRVLLTIHPNGTVEGEIEDASEARLFVARVRGMVAQPTQSDAIERVLCEANGCVWDLDPDSDSRKQWRRDVETVLAALQEQSK